MTNPIILTIWRTDGEKKRRDRNKMAVQCYLSFVFFVFLSSKSSEAIIYVFAFFFFYLFLLYFVKQVGGWLTRCYRSFARARAGEERDLRQRSTFSNKRRGLVSSDGAQIQRQRLCCTFSSQ